MLEEGRESEKVEGGEEEEDGNIWWRLKTGNIEE